MVELTAGIVLPTLAAWVVGMVVAYLVMKAAVRNGILEADAQRRGRGSTSLPPDSDELARAIGRSRREHPSDQD